MCNQRLEIAATATRVASAAEVAATATAAAEISTTTARIVAEIAAGAGVVSVLPGEAAVIATIAQVGTEG